MRPLRGIALMMTAVTFFVIMSSLIKFLDRIPAGEAVFFRSAFAMPVIVLWLMAQGGVAEGLRTTNVRGHVLRGLLGTTAMGLGFAGLRYLPLPEVTALRFITPVLIVVFAAVILGERLRLVRLSAVAVGLIGVLIIMWPRLNFQGGGRETLGVVVILASATSAAFAQIFVKSMAGVEKTAAIVFYFSVTAATLSLLSLPFGWVVPTPTEALLLVSTGLIGGFGQMLLTASYRYADASVLAPFTYVTMIWALLIGYFVFAELPTIPMLLGASLIIMSGVAIVLRERQLGLRATALRKVSGKGMQ